MSAASLQREEWQASDELNAGRRGLLLAIVAVIAGAPLGVGAVTLSWKGHTWQVTSGGMAGVCQGSPNNVTIDASGYLHFKISNSGGAWTASEMFTTDKLGFGTYQWQVDGPIDTYDKNVVLGLFPYGPAAGIGGDGTNEIDIEYSRWGQANGPNGDWTDYPASGTTIGELAYTFTLGGGTLSTSRFHWTNTSIASSLLGGLQPVDGTTGLIKSWTYAPQNPTTNIPQQALPLGMNLWCFNGPPTDGQPVEIVIRDFQFVPEGAGGGAGGGGAAGGGGRGGGTVAPGRPEAAAMGDAAAWAAATADAAAWAAAMGDAAAWAAATGDAAAWAAEGRERPGGGARPDPQLAQRAHPERRVRPEDPATRARAEPPGPRARAELPVPRARAELPASRAFRDRPARRVRRDCPGPRGRPPAFRDNRARRKAAAAP